MSDERRLLPKDPPAELLLSMALRFDHGLGLPGYYDSLYGEGEHELRLQSTLAQMRQLYEEVSGYGFFDWSKYAEAAAVIATSAPAAPQAGD